MTNKFIPAEIFEGFISCQPLPSLSALEEYYKEEFYGSEKPGFVNDSSKLVRDQDSDFYDIQYQIFANLLGVINGSVHLDLGCGYGHFLNYLSANFPATELIGAEVYTEAAGYIESISNAKFAHVDLNASPYFKEVNFSNISSVSIINTLEHLMDPIDFCSELFSNICSGTVVLVQVPNDFNIIQLAANTSLSTGDWWFCPPRHISYFSPIGLSKLFVDAGFQQNHIINTFPIDMLLLCGLNYRADPKIGREAHLMRCQFELNFINAHGLQGLIELYRGFCACGIGREIIGVFVKP